MERIKIIGDDNLYLSQLTLEDASLLENWHRDIDIIKNVGAFNDVFGYQDAKQWFYEGKHKYFYMIIDAFHNKPIGYCDLYDINRKDKIATLGISIGDKASRNKGYGQKAVHLLVKYAFEELDINNIMLTVKEFNLSAINCYLKVGFKEIGRRHQSYLFENKHFDVVYMEILKESFDL